MLMSIISQANLRAPVNPEISCTDASTSGGTTAVETKFKLRFLEVPDALEDKRCGARCHDVLEDDALSFPCGLWSCSPQCVLSRMKGLAAHGIAIQPPLDIKIASYPWDFFTDSGKQKLDSMEADNSLAASHWAPECKTFSAARADPLKERPYNPRAPGVEIKERPWGLPNLTEDENIQVRQGNAIGKRSLQGFKEGRPNGSCPSNTHGDPSFGKLLRRWSCLVTRGCSWPGCWGGWRWKWTCLITSDPALKEALHRPHCPGHYWLRLYEVHETATGLRYRRRG